MAKPTMFNVERMIAVVAAEHRFILKPDDAAFALVTMNRLVLEESLEAIRAVVNQDLAQLPPPIQAASCIAISHRTIARSHATSRQAPRKLTGSKLPAAFPATLRARGVMAAII